MNKDKYKIIFGKRVKVYEPENLRSPRGPSNQVKPIRKAPKVKSLLSSSETYQKKIPKSDLKGLTSKRKTIPKKLSEKWRLRRFRERSKKEIGDQVSLSRTDPLQSEETKTKKRSLRNRIQSGRTHVHTKNPFNVPGQQNKLAISDIIDPRPAQKHQLWISSLTRNRKNSRTNPDGSLLNPYLNMSSFNISDDISHIIPSFSSKVNPNSSRYHLKGDDSNRNSVISQSNFLKNNQSISGIEPDNLSYRFITKDDPNSIFGDIIPDADFQVNLYDNSGGNSTKNQTFNRANRAPGKGDKVIPRFNSSCNTLHYNPSEFSKRIMTHKKNKPSLDVYQLPTSGVVIPKSRHYSQPNNELPGIQ